MVTFEAAQRFADQEYPCGDGSGFGAGWSDNVDCSWGLAYGDWCDDVARGSGEGEGSGWGCGEGEGIGWGCGEGISAGECSGVGGGFKFYDSLIGIKRFCGAPVCFVDELVTVIDQIRGNIARGRLLHEDMTTTPCYVVKRGNVFAHGSDLHEAVKALDVKLFKTMPCEEKVKAFLTEFPNLDEERPNREFFAWHNHLTGSCEMGRREFAWQHGVDVEHGTMSVRAFLELTKDAYGGEIIRKILERGERK